MLKIISSKNESLIYSEIKKIKLKEKLNSQTQKLILELAESHAQDISIFGDKEIFLIEIKSEDIDNLEKINFNILENSEHLFILVGNGVEFIKTCDELIKKFKIKLEIIKPFEKVVFDFPAEMVAAMQKGDKKNSWGLLIKELENKDAEPIHGSCVFAYKSLLTHLNDTKKNNSASGVKDFSWQQAKRNSGKRERQEVINKYFELILAYHKARMGNGDLATQLESWVLKS